jgi:hypothetical protein
MPPRGAGTTASAAPRQDPQRAKVEILKRLDGDLAIVPRPSTTGERRAEISSRERADRPLEFRFEIAT